MTAFPTGNPNRDAAIIAVLRETIDEQSEPLTWANVALKCERFGPSFGDLSEEEFTLAVASLDASQADTASESSTPVESAEPAPSTSRDDANARIVHANNDLARARGALITAVNRQKQARAVLSAAIQAFVAGQAPVTRTQAVKDAIASYQQEKAERPPRVLRSVVDRHAAYSTGGDASDFTRKQLQTGHRRGSLPASMKGRRVAVARVPSER
jgi:hypothetical protein